MYQHHGSNEKGVVAASVDLGSNSFRLLIAVISEKGFQPLVKDLVTVRLGQDLAKTGALSLEAMGRGREALKRFAQTLQAHQPATCRVCGTHALRQASNRETFLAEAEALLGQPVEIIPATEEAALSLQGALYFLGGKARYPLLLADVGGGSCEFVFVKDKEQELFITSIPIGAVSLSEIVSGKNPAKGETELSLLQKHTRSIFGNEPQRSFFMSLAAKCQLIGTGGTATALAALDCGLMRYDGEAVQGYILPRTRLCERIDTLSLLLPAERSKLPGLDRNRGEILLAGAVIYRELLSLLATESLVVSDAGLLEGLLFSGFDGVMQRSSVKE